MSLWCRSPCIWVTQAAPQSPTAERWPSKSLLWRAPKGPASCDTPLSTESHRHSPLILANASVRSHKDPGTEYKRMVFCLLTILSYFPSRIYILYQPYCSNKGSSIKWGKKYHYIITSLYQTVWGVSLFKVCFQAPGGFLWSSWAACPQAPRWEGPGLWSLGF